MAGSVQCVFLIDDSIFYSNNDNSHDNSSRMCEMSRLAVLRLLCYLSSRARSSCVRWSYKFFDSGGSCAQVVEKQGLYNFCLESFEDFESFIVVRADRSRAVKSLNSRKLEPTGHPNTNQKYIMPNEILKMVFHQLYADYIWDLPDISSPIKFARNHKHKKVFQQHENYVIVFAPFNVFLPHGGGGDPFRFLLPKSLYQTFSTLVHLLWIDSLHAPYDLDPKISRLLPLQAVIGDRRDTSSDSLPPLSALMNAVLTPTPQNKDPKFVEKPLTLWLKGKEVCQLSLSTLRKSFQVNLEFGDAIILGSLPISWTIGTLALHGSVMTGSLKNSSQHCYSSSCFFSLLLKLKQNSQMLVLEMKASTENVKLCLLQPFGASLCHLIPLIPGLTIEGLVGTKCNEQLQSSSFVPSAVEQWTVPNTQFNIMGVSNSNRLQAKRQNLQSLKKYYRKLSLNLSHKQELRSVPNPSESVKAASDQDLFTSSQDNLHRNLVNSSSNLQSHKSGIEEQVSPCASMSTAEGIHQINSNCDTDILKDLHGEYQEAIEGRKSLEKVAEDIAHCLRSLALSKDLLVRDLSVREQFLLSAKTVGEKHGVGGLGHQRELQLQALLHLEIQLHSKNNSKQNTEIENSCLYEVVVLLRTFSFLAGAPELNHFLLDVIKPRYGSKLQSLLDEIGEELNVPLSTDTDSSSDDESDVIGIEEQLFSVSSASSTSLSSISQKPSYHKPWGRTLSMLAAPPSRREIKVPRTLVRTSSNISKTKKIKNNAKNKYPSAKKNKLKNTVDKDKNEPEKVRRKLFGKLNQKGKTVPLKWKSESYLCLKNSQKSNGNSPNYKDSRLKSRSPKVLSQSVCKTPSQKERPNSYGFTPTEKFPELIDNPDNEVCSPCKTPRRKTVRRSLRTPLKTPKHQEQNTSCTPNSNIPIIFTDSPASCTRSKMSPVRAWTTPTSNKNSQNYSVNKTSGRRRNLNFDIENMSPSRQLRTPKKIIKIVLGNTQGISPSKTSRTTPRKSLEIVERATKQISPSSTPKRMHRKSCGSLQSDTVQMSPSETPWRTPQKSLESVEHATKQLSPSSTPRRTHRNSFGFLQCDTVEMSSSKPARRTPRKSPETVELVTKQISPSKTPRRTPRKSFESLQCDIELISPNRTPKKTPKKSLEIMQKKSICSRAETSAISKSFSPGKTLCGKEISSIPDSNSSCSAESMISSKDLCAASPLKRCLKEPNGNPCHAYIEMKTERSLSYDTPKKNAQETKLFFGSPTNRSSKVLPTLDNSESYIKISFESSIDNSLDQTFFKSPCRTIQMRSYTLSTPKKMSPRFKNISSPVSIKDIHDNKSKPAIPNLNGILLESLHVSASKKSQKNNTAKQQIVNLSTDLQIQSPISHLTTQPESCMKPYTKTSPVLSVRWPQKKRKFSPVRKKHKTNKNVSTVYSPDDCKISPPSKKHNFGKQYTSPSTTSILHLTTSPVIFAKDSLSKSGTSLSNR